MNLEKSVITCDLEGRIQTFSDGACEIFGYAREEVVGKKRVSAFSPGEVVLEHVPKWLKAAVKDGEMHTRTVFVRKDGTPFAADIRISPTFKGDVQIGYCGVTVPLPDVDPKDAYPSISLLTKAFRWLVVTRAPFLTAALVPVLLGGAWVAHTTPGPFPWAAFVLALIGGLALQVAANTFNDYFDWTSGTDQANNEYFLPFSGGSRAIELGLVSLRGLLVIACGAVVLAAACGIALVVLSTPLVLAWGAVGALVALFYTAPPLRLAARKGLGELSVGLCFGPLMTAGTVTALTGTFDLRALLVGVPVGLLTTAILWINELPDAPSDALTGKRNLVVVLGKKAARWGYLVVVVAAFASLLGLVVAGVLPPIALAALISLPWAAKAVRVLFVHWNDRELVSANAATIVMHAVAGFVLAAAVAFA